MSVQKYKIAKEFKEGVVARILHSAIDPSKSKDFKVGYNWASEVIMVHLYDTLNEYLVNIGEEKIEMVEAMRNE